MNKASERQARYDAKATTRVALKLNNNTDADILEWLNEQFSKQGSIKTAIRLLIDEEKKWHDLKVNPEDLPVDNRQVLVAYGYKDYDVAEYWKTDGWGETINKIIAWRYIEDWSKEDD